MSKSTLPDDRSLRGASPLAWLERALWTVGIVLALWCGYVWYDARRVAQMPVPSASGSRQLPGENDAVGTAGTASARVARGQWVAKLDAPAIQLTATVLEGTDARTLRRGAGHIEDTPLPGAGGNVGIAGHRDTTFRPVRNLKVGDQLTLTTASAVYEYRVATIRIVNPENVEVLDPTAQPSLTLVTCYPFNYIGNAPKRYIVRADLTREARREGRVILKAPNPWTS
jgi:sortase A